MTQSITAMPDVIYAYKSTKGIKADTGESIEIGYHGTGTWIDFDDSSPDDPATEYRLSTPDTIAVTKDDWQRIVGALEDAEKRFTAIDHETNDVAEVKCREALAIAAKYGETT